LLPVERYANICVIAAAVGRAQRCVGPWFEHFLEFFD
jgi:hypothetical protein